LAWEAETVCCCCCCWMNCCAAMGDSCGYMELELPGMAATLLPPLFSRSRTLLSDRCCLAAAADEAAADRAEVDKVEVDVADVPKRAGLAAEVVMADMVDTVVMAETEEAIDGLTADDDEMFGREEFWATRCGATTGA